MKRYVIITMSILCSQFSVAQQSLKDLQELAIANNSGLLSRYKSYESAQLLAAKRSGMPDPTLGVGYFVMPIETRVGPQRAVISASQTLPWFGSRASEEAAGDAAAAEALQAYNTQVSRVKLDVALLYYQIYVVHNKLQTTSATMELLESRKLLTENKLESGNGSLLEVLEVDMAIEILKKQLYDYEEDMEPLLVELKRLINSEPDDLVIPVTLWTDTLNMTKEQIMSEVESSNQELKTIDYRLSALNYELRSTEKQSTPSITVGLNYTIVGERSGYSGEDNGRDALLPTIGVKLPLYRKKYNAQTSQKSIQIEAQKYHREEELNRLEQQLSQAISDYSEAVREVEMNRKLITYATQAMNILITQYSSAEVEFNSLIEMDRRLLSYKLALLEAEAQRNSHVAFIDYLRGN